MNRKALTILALAGASSLAAGGIASAAGRDDGANHRQAEIRQEVEAEHPAEVEAEHPAEVEVEHGTEVNDDRGVHPEPGDDRGVTATTEAAPAPVPATTPSTVPASNRGPGRDDAAASGSNRGPGSSSRGPGDDSPRPTMTTTVTTAPHVTTTVRGHDGEAEPGDDGHDGGRSGSGGSSGGNSGRH